ncbi:Integrating conjugative element protein, PFL_4709 family [Pseudomonas sp. 8Z]|uniref:TIGR03757 family integrating conjugative element protein n=1 Tax=Pseudomonas sp. 8Z TaxID=2653166 RepID=UPI0012F34559|nr:TIGR03757 family integrating conjugative element protein [Pseudomonas sp. 8Z]VXC22813.1 Integrating conjugative element protein, PFL_4709 family [Pseudomonas sp. 8Z]
MPTLLHFRLLPHLVAASTLAVSIVAQAETWVVTDRNHPIQSPAGVRLILLGEKDRLEERLTRALPANPQLAAAAFPQFMSSQEGRSLIAELAKAQQDAADAWSTGVEKIPAVVVDRTYVVYGVSDVVAAEAMISQARSTQQ